MLLTLNIVYNCVYTNWVEMSDDNLNNLNNLNNLGDTEPPENNGGREQPFDPFASFMAGLEARLSDLAEGLQTITRRVADCETALSDRTTRMADFLKQEKRDRVSDISAASIWLNRLESATKDIVEDQNLRFESIGNMVDARLTAQAAEIKGVKDELTQLKLQAKLDQRNANTVLTAGLSRTQPQTAQPKIQLFQEPPRTARPQPQPSQSQPHSSQQFQGGAW